MIYSLRLRIMFDEDDEVQRHSATNEIQKALHKLPLSVRDAIEDDLRAPSGHIENTTRRNLRFAPAGMA